MQLLDRLRPNPISLFAAVTLLIWGNRVWLAWSDAKLGVLGKLGYSVPITAFVVAALATLGMQLSDRARGRRFRSLVAALAVGTLAYWAVRLPVILFRHHSVPFKLIHTVLALVLVALAVRVVAFLGRSASGRGRPRPRAPQASAS